MLRRRPRKLPKLPDPPKGKMFNPYDIRDEPFLLIKEVQEWFGYQYEHFDDLSPERRRQEWGADYFDGEINRRKKARV